MGRFALDEGLLHSSVSQTFFARGHLVAWKITAGPYILAHLSIEYADDTYLNLKKNSHN
jgi:hypothetical protein